LRPMVRASCRDPWPGRDKCVRQTHDILTRVGYNLPSRPRGWSARDHLLVWNAGPAWMSALSFENGPRRHKDRVSVRRDVPSRQASPQQFAW
jgi:hypothetical protein